MTQGMVTPPHVSAFTIEPMLVFFDGDCAMCHRSIRFLLRRSRVESFRFVPLQSLANTEWENAIRTQLGHDLQASIVVWCNGEFLNRSRAVLAISVALGFTNGALSSQSPSTKTEPAIGLQEETPAPAPYPSTSAST